MPQNIRTFLFETASSRSSSQKQTTRPEACCRAHKCWPPVLIVQAPGKSLEDVWPTLSIDSALTCSKLERLTFPSKHAMKGFTVKSRVPNLDYDFWSALLHRPVLCPIHILGSGNHQRSDNPRQTPQHGAPPGHVSAGLFEGCLMLMLNGTALTFMILFFVQLTLHVKKRDWTCFPCFNVIASPVMSGVTKLLSWTLIQLQTEIFCRRDVCNALLMGIITLHPLA